MKTFKKIAAQGDFVIRRIKNLPAGSEEVAAKDGNHIIAHSETGHHHVIAADHVRAFRGSNPLILFLVVDKPAPIIHQRGWDTHEPLVMKSSGVYEVRNQREYTPEGFRRAAD